MTAQEFLAEHPYETCYVARLGYLDFYVTAEELERYEANYGPQQAKAMI